jgi:hypothetical protein
MWAVIGVWEIDPSLIEEGRAQVPEMAQGTIGMPGFLHGTWTQDGHVMMVFADEQTARRYHGDMLAQGAVERPGLRCIVWDAAEVGAESGAPDHPGISCSRWTRTTA